MRASEISAFQILKMSVGPSSSHTHGPLLIGNRFRHWLAMRPELHHAKRIRIKLCWSLARTGKGHMTDNAILAGLLGYDPVSDDLDVINSALDKVIADGCINLGPITVTFNVWDDMLWANEERLPLHENGMTLSLLAEDGQELASRNYYSIGGGMIQEEEEDLSGHNHSEPHPYQYMQELLEIAKREGLSFSEIVKRNTAKLEGLTPEAVVERMTQIWRVMKDCVARGLKPRESVLPGVLRVKRRAPRLFEAAKSPKGHAILNKQDIVAYATAFAYAVSEENAASGRVVTAPTNGGAGVCPGTLYASQYVHRFEDEEMVEVLFTAAGIGALIQANASISGSEVGCQGEVGAACSMTAGALAQLYGGDIGDVEYAAEIAMEHSLGLECTPMQGYVQIPCIERNGIFAAKAISAAQHAITLKDHRISLDLVIQKMYENGKRMDPDFKETSRAGFGPIQPDREF